MSGGATRQYGRDSFEASNLDKVLFPDDDLTKGDIIEYYERISELMLPHLRDRALVMHRFPDGIDSDGFYHKQVPDHFPAWIDRTTVKTSDGTQTLVVCNKQSTLAYLANQGCITPHRWLSRTDEPDHPDLLNIDLDPPGNDFAPVRSAAQQCRALCDELEISSFLMTTGSRGLHVVIPLDRSADFDTVRSTARDMMTVLAARHADELTTEQRKNKRRGRLYLDVMRNSYAQTAVAPYALRAKPGAPIATPLDWSELSSRNLTAQTYSMKNIFRRLAQRDDPWKHLARHAISASTLRERIDALDQL